MSLKQSKPISLAKIAEAVRQHILRNTLDADRLNTHLWLIARVAVELHSFSTPEANTTARFANGVRFPRPMNANGSGDVHLLTGTDRGYVWSLRRHAKTRFQILGKKE